MSVVKLPDIKLIHRRLLHPYTVITKYQKEELRKESHLPSQQKEYLGKSISGDKRPGLRKLNTPKEEITDDTNRRRGIPCSKRGSINTLKLTILPKAIHRFRAIPVRRPMAFFQRIRTKTFTVCMETQKTPNRF